MCIVGTDVAKEKKPGQRSRNVVESSRMQWMKKEEEERHVGHACNREREGGLTAARFVTVFDPSLLIKRPTLGCSRQQ